MYKIQFITYLLVYNYFKFVRSKEIIVGCMWSRGSNVTTSVLNILSIIEGDGEVADLALCGKKQKKLTRHTPTTAVKQKLKSSVSRRQNVCKSFLKKSAHIDRKDFSSP